MKIKYPEIGGLSVNKAYIGNLIPMKCISKIFPSPLIKGGKG